MTEPGELGVLGVAVTVTVGAGRGRIEVRGLCRGVCTTTPTTPREVKLTAGRTSAVWVSAPALPLTDTVKRVDPERQVIETPPREQLWTVQTPQIFRRDLVQAALAATDDDATDEAALIERTGSPVRVFEGEAACFKITTPADLDLDGLLGQAELGGDVLLGDTFKFAEDENFTAAGRQRVHRFEQEGLVVPTLVARAHRVLDADD